MKKLTENMVLKKLDIQGFDRLTPQKVIQMAPMLSEMEPEVAIKALEQFPEFSNTIKGVVGDIDKNLEKAMSENKEVTLKFYDSCKSTIDILNERLSKGDLQVEERKDILSTIVHLLEMMDHKDSENKKFLHTLSLICGAVGGVALASAAVVLGSKLDINKL